MNQHPNIYRDVLQFNRACLPGMVDRTDQGLSTPPDNSRHLGAGLVLEEVCELMQALHVGFEVHQPTDPDSSELYDHWLAGEMEGDDVVDAVDAAADILYVTLGMMQRLGVTEEQFYAVWREVTRANMDKANGPLREDGKRLKPEGWRAPDVAGALGVR